MKALLILLSSAVLLHSASAAESRPNILLFYADDLGYGELGCYGFKEVPTPNIDSIAANGIRFTNGYVSAPLCSPSRAGLMTGRYQQRFGHENNMMTAEKGLPIAEKTFGDRMKALGYATGAVGKWHLGNDPAYLPMKRGFDDYFGVFGNPGSYFTPKGLIDSKISAEPQKAPENFYTTDAFAARASEWITSKKEAPWFLYMPFNAVHSPHEATEKYLQRFTHISDPKRRQFDAMLAAMDDAVGVVLAKVRELKLEERTLIYFISDNGSPNDRGEANGPLHGKKHTCWEGGIRLPWLMQWKGTLPAGKIEDRPVIQLDVLPTCVSAAGGTVDPAWKLDGVNLLPFVKGENSERPHPTLYWRIDNMWAVRHGDMKLVSAEAGREPELFDLAADIGETKNLASAQPEKAAELKRLWDDWNTSLTAPAFGAKHKMKKAKGKGKRMEASKATPTPPSEPETTPKSKKELRQERKKKAASKAAAAPAVDN
ncbi:sulfatase family protein [Brevifollis gellanilyticus]|uniref:N-acetylgalactosamine-6-sulfatase n=1 Tax=Brevifollis gellanilyticus TaxID=748831 RepID=A0A512M7P4_9BACT|nr:sulfatase-like hydrolase/transferase [Brevifollis gellanilyticus]GEP42756.1 N-acetylgalactosamine-6-sulfatase [Brevifollis gellanilyticus]